MGVQIRFPPMWTGVQIGFSLSPFLCADALSGRIVFFVESEYADRDLLQWGRQAAGQSTVSLSQQVLFSSLQHPSIHQLGAGSSLTRRICNSERAGKTLGLIFHFSPRTRQWFNNTSEAANFCFLILIPCTSRKKASL